MRILVFGGTRFLGRHLVEAAVRRGHRVTLFNRGILNPGLFKSLEQRRGDRIDDIGKLDGGEWDVVLDVSGYFPRQVRTSTQYLKDRVPYYAYISTVSVYAESREKSIVEEHPVGTTDDPTVEVLGTKAYGPLKALCEDAVRAAYPIRSLIVRPGLVVGPLDHTNRFTYWVTRIAEGGPTLAPEPRDRPVQFIDARDVAAFTLSMIEGQETGTYNAVGPAGRLTMIQLLELIRKVTGGAPSLTWVAEEFLLKAGVTPYTEVPLWIPSRNGQIRDSGYAIDKAQAKGLTLRPLAETIADTLAWDRADPDPKRGVAMTRAREAELLNAWSQQR